MARKSVTVQCAQCCGDMCRVQRGLSQPEILEQPFKEQEEEDVNFPSGGIAGAKELRPQTVK